jgi:hypothetical protein
VTAEVESKGFLGENLLHAIGGALSFGYVYLSMGCCDRLSNFKEFLREVELWEILEVVIALLNDKRAGEHKGKMELFFVHFEH